MEIVKQIEDIEVQKTDNAYISCGQCLYRLTIHREKEMHTQCRKYNKDLEIGSYVGNVFRCVECIEHFGAV